MYTVYRHAPWEHGATGARAAPGFASQVDLAALFVERSLALLRPSGTISLLLPAKLWRSLAGGGVRQLLLDRLTVTHLADWSDSQSAFDAAVYPSLVVARGSAASPAAECRVAVHGTQGDTSWEVRPPASLAIDDTPGAPWILLAPPARAGFGLLRAAGIPMMATGFRAPRLGVKSGCNAAFLVHVTGESHGLAVVQDADGATGTIEAALLRPALRGDAVVAWRRPPCEESIVWTHAPAGAPLARLPSHASAWLRRHYDDLATRSDARRARRWWTLFRVDAADAGTPRVVWSDFGRRPRAAVLLAGDPVVPLNTCYVVPCAGDADAWALAALLNSPLIAAWLNAVAEPARGRYRRYLGWTVGLLPMPRDWSRARSIMAEAAFGDDDALTEATLTAYGLRKSAMQALIDTLAPR